MDYWNPWANKAKLHVMVVIHWPNSMEFKLEWILTWLYNKTQPLQKTQANNSKACCHCSTDQWTSCKGTDRFWIAGGLHVYHTSWATGCTTNQTDKTAYCTAGHPRVTFQSEFWNKGAICLWGYQCAMLLRHHECTELQYHSWNPLLIPTQDHGWPKWITCHCWKQGTTSYQRGSGASFGISHCRITRRMD